ncbi:hypothetical protein GCM10020219_001330 [Nonomuraea dietziae]
MLPQVARRTQQSEVFMVGHLARVVRLAVAPLLRSDLRQRRRGCRLGGDALLKKSLSIWLRARVN